MTLHPLQMRWYAEDLVRLRRSDELRRYAAPQRSGHIDANPHQIEAVIFALSRLGEGGCILADQLVQSDQTRLEWFRAALHQAAALVQVIVLTCRREDYVSSPAGESTTITRVNLAEKIRRAE